MTLRRIIIDNGSYMIKTGYAGDDFPKSWLVEEDGKELRKKVEEKTWPPIRNRIITNWEYMMKVWESKMFGLNQEPEDCFVLLTEPHLNPKSTREEMTRVMFDKFKVASLYIEVQLVLSLFASLTTTGVVIDCGYETTIIAPICDGNIITHAVRQISIGGKALTTYLMRLLPGQPLNPDNMSHRKIAREIKEKLCYVAGDYKKELKKAENGKKYHLEKYYERDQFNTTITSERFRCPEVLFDPMLLKKEESGLHEAIFSSIQDCDKSQHEKLFSNIVLAGGSSMFDGLDTRLMTELQKLAQSRSEYKAMCKVLNVIAPPDRANSAWMGGSILAPLKTFEALWITREEFKEQDDVTIIHRKCF